MIPLRDDNPTELQPFVTVAFIAACVVVFLYQVTLPEQAGHRFVFEFGFIPALFFGDARPSGWTPGVPAEATLFTSMFLHGGWLHLIGNMLYLWIFGNNVEDAVGHVRFVLFYLACGVAAALIQGFADPSSALPMVGASGAIAGVLGAYLLLYPHAQVLVLIPLGFFTQLVRIPALFVLGFWFLLQFVQQAMSSGAGGEQGGVAYMAHIGGFITGGILILFLRRRGVPLFHQAQPHVHGGRMARMPPRPRHRSSRIPDSGGDDNPRGPWA
jgi:membrane associated rhomboid family serine protease